MARRGNGGQGNRETGERDVSSMQRSALYIISCVRLEKFFGALFRCRPRRGHASRSFMGREHWILVQPYPPQHLLNFFSEPQWQGSFRPTFVVPDRSVQTPSSMNATSGDRSFLQTSARTPLGTIRYDTIRYDTIRYDTIHGGRRQKKLPWFSSTNGPGSPRSRIMTN